MNGPVLLQRHDDIAVLVIDNPPVNAPSWAMIEGLAAAIDAFEADTYPAPVISC